MVIGFIGAGLFSGWLFLWLSDPIVNNVLVIFDIYYA